ncbi:hypothetical protein F5887DRAFT_1075288 [Amanita rubescens]|nr:hypothetical protein F5887DRAFT_1075288 [Amanita rubescens]
MSPVSAGPGLMFGSSFPVLVSSSPVAPLPQSGLPANHLMPAPVLSQSQSQPPVFSQPQLALPALLPSTVFSQSLVQDPPGYHYYHSGYHYSQHPVSQSQPQAINVGCIQW